MFRISGLTCRLSSFLADKLRRLHTSMSDLGQRLRATIATRVADDLAMLVQEVVETALAARDPEPLRMTYRSSPTSRQRSDDYLRSSYQAESGDDLFGGYPSGPETRPCLV